MACLFSMIRHVSWYNDMRLTLFLSCSHSPSFEMTFLGKKLEDIEGSLISAKMHQIQVVSEIRYLFLFLRLYTSSHSPTPKKKKKRKVVKGRKLGRRQKQRIRRNANLAGYGKHSLLLLLCNCADVLSITKYMKRGGFFSLGIR